MSRVTSSPSRFCPEMPWLAMLAMLCQLLAPVLYAPHHQALTQEFERAVAGYAHHAPPGRGQSGDPSSCLVHMALHAAANGAAAAPPPALPIRVAVFAPAMPVLVALFSESRTWRPQSSRAPPRSGDLLPA